MRIFYTTLLLLLPRLMVAESAVELKAAYDVMRRDGFIKVHEDHLTKLKAAQKELLQAQKLDAANAIQTDIEQVGIRIALFKSGENPTVPGLIPSDQDSGDLSAEPGDPIVPEEIGKMRREFIERLRRGLTVINEAHYRKSSEAQKIRMAAADLTGANAFEALKTELKAELDAMAGSSPKPASLSPGRPGNGDDLLAEPLRKRWVEVSGKWEFKSDAIVGSGNSEMRYNAKIRTPFVLTFDFEVKKGMRPRVYLGKGLRIANEGYQHQIGLYPPVGKEEPVPYQLGKKHSVKLVANRRFLELYLDDKLVSKRDTGLADDLEYIGFWGGDGYSPGTTEYSNIRIE